MIAPLDRMNPVMRLVCAGLLAAPVLITLDWVSSLCLFALEFVIFAATGAGLTRMLRGLIPVLIVGVIASLSMALYGRPGGPVYAQWWWITISHQSLLMALAVFVRVLALALAAQVLLARVDPTLMADGLAQRLHLPARFVLGTLAGVRMLGLFAADWRMLGLARRARGLGEDGALRRYATMAFALLVAAIRRGSTLATAMEVRGFTAQAARHRTWARPSDLGPADAVGLVVTLLVCTASLVAAVWAGTFWFIWFGPPS
ncbi:MAG: energy-coupling factor transporter transmembrane protein EcfT [Propionibacteriaceae bacterium]|nr:energy-coupling factor transporter transmembrane protein EcfT [Propionibacteriaceae bacterium]